MARSTTITGEGIRGEKVESADIASGSIKAGELSAQAVSGQALITEPAGASDRLLIWDATDSSLKQAAPTNLFVESGTAVGIGTGTDGPDNTLHVKSPGTTHIKIESQAGYEAAIKMNAGSTSTYVWTPGNTADIRLYAGGADRVHVDNDGNVGIGTTDPDYNLHVASAASAVVLIDGASNTDAFLRFGQAGTLKSYIKQGSGGNLVITNETADKDIILSVKDDATEREAIRVNGDVAEVVINEGSDSLVDFRVESDSNAYMLFVDGSSNNVGINHSTPASTLTVQGSLALSVLNINSANDPGTTYSVSPTDYVALINTRPTAQGGIDSEITISLPLAASYPGRVLVFKDVAGYANVNNIIIKRDGSDTIEGVAITLTLNNIAQKTTLISDGVTNWAEIGN